jgi:hypothetical protein
LSRQHQLNVYRIVFGTNPQQRRDASPITHVGPNKPPFLIMYAQFDFPGFDAQARQLLSLLREYGNEAALIEIPNRDHVTIIFECWRAQRPNNPRDFEVFTEPLSVGCSSKSQVRSERPPTALSAVTGSLSKKIREHCRAHRLA